MHPNQSTNITGKKLKRVVVKEELVALTKDFTKAVILNQMIYWSERVADFDQFIMQEKNRAKHSGVEINILETNGWIYKTADELSEETMLGLSPSAMREQLKKLVAAGYLSERRNPEHKWDRTIQYRVNLIKIQRELLSLGYSLEGYRVNLNLLKELFDANMLPFSETENAFSPTKNANSENENAIYENENAFSDTEIPFSETENAFSETKNGISETEDRFLDLENRTLANQKAIPEITTEYINTNHSFNHSGKNTIVEPPEGLGLNDGLNDEINESDIELITNYATHKLKGLVSSEEIMKLKDRLGFWAGYYGVNEVKYAIDRLAEQDNVTNIAKWMEGPLKRPYDYPPRVGFKRKLHEQNRPETKADQKKRSLMRTMYS